MNKTTRREVWLFVKSPYVWLMAFYSLVILPSVFFDNSTPLLVVTIIWAVTMPFGLLAHWNLCKQRAERGE